VDEVLAAHRRRRCGGAALHLGQSCARDHDGQLPYGGPVAGVAYGFLNDVANYTNFAAIVVVA